jgi:hypothetical protein
MQETSGESSEQKTDFESEATIISPPGLIVVLSAPVDDGEYRPHATLLIALRIEGGKLARLLYDGSELPGRVAVLIAEGAPTAPSERPTLGGLVLCPSHATASAALRSAWEAARRAQRRLGQS